MFNLKQRISIVVMTIMLVGALNLCFWVCHSFLPKWIDVLGTIISLFFVIYFYQVLFDKIMDGFKSKLPDED